jgi:hypothetical protein
MEFELFCCCLSNVPPMRKFITLFMSFNGKKLFAFALPCEDKIL